jgi:phosphoglycolate phosphatase-like HAD superfamily hydrolase
MVGDTAEDFSAAAIVGMQAAIVAQGYGNTQAGGQPADCRIIAEFGQITSDYFGGAA